MLKGISCAIRVMVRIHCESCLIDCVGSMLRYGEKGAIVAKQRSFSLCRSSPATMYFSRGLFIIEMAGF